MVQCRGWVVVLAVISTFHSALAQDKSGYWLFNRTPDHLLRDMTTDRPDITESPFTIDAGRIQAEATLLGFARSRPGELGAETHSFDFMTTNIRVGLTHNSEINIVWQPHGIARTQGAVNVAALNESGIGGLDLRGKINLWGNDNFDDAGSALAILPFVSLPTDDDNGISPDGISAGFIVPFALSLPANFGLGLNGGVVWVREDGGGYRPEYLATAAISYEWTDKFATYHEVSGAFNTGDPRSDSIVYLGSGLTYAVNDNLQLDAGFNVGVTDAADRISPFVGLSQRF
jgi:hypothetical protein